MDVLCSLKERFPSRSREGEREHMEARARSTCLDILAFSLTDGWQDGYENRLEKVGSCGHFVNINIIQGLSREHISLHSHAYMSSRLSLPHMHLVSSNMMLGHLDSLHFRCSTTPVLYLYITVMLRGLHSLSFTRYKAYFPPVMLTLRRSVHEIWGRFLFQEKGPKLSQTNLQIFYCYLRQKMTWHL